MKARRTVILLAAFAVLVGACTAAGETERTTSTTTATVEEEPSPDTIPPDVDMTRHDVPLEEIYFDTFDGNAVPLSESTPELRQRLLDAIRPIDQPRYGDAAEGDWLDPTEPVVGYLAGDQAYAYPFKILNFHEIVNDTLGGVPVLISYCPLCRSAVVYDRRVDGQVLSFGNTSALYESDLVMVDRNTGSYWWQVPGRAIVGPLTGTQLNALPSRVATWADWADAHPDTLILTRDTGLQINYERDPFATYDQVIDSGQFAFPVGEEALDPRLAPSAMVVGVSIDGTTHAYAVEALEGPLSDDVAGTPIVVFPNEGGASVFSPIVDGDVLEFVSRNEGFVDRATGSEWSVDGVALSGPLAGASLQPMPSRTSFWFAMIGAFPDLTLVG